MEDIKNNNIHTSRNFDDEIDLFELLNIIMRRKNVIILTVLSFLIISFAYLSIAKNIYLLEGYLMIPDLSKKDINKDINKDIITFLKQIKSNYGKKKFAKDRLKLTDSEFLSLKNVSIDEKNTSNNIVIVKVEVTNRDDGKQILSKISNYLNSITYYNNLIILKKDLLSEERSQLMGQLEKYNNLISRIKDGTVVLGFDPIEAYKNTKLRILFIEKELKDFDNIYRFRYITEPVVPDKPEKPNKMLVIVISVISGLFLGIFLTLFIEWYKNNKRGIN